MHIGKEGRKEGGKEGRKDFKLGTCNHISYEEGGVVVVVVVVGLCCWLINLL